MSGHLAVVTRRSKKWSKLLQGTVKVEKNLKGRLFNVIIYIYILLLFYCIKLTHKSFSLFKAVIWVCSEALCEEGGSM